MNYNNNLYQLIGMDYSNLCNFIDMNIIKCETIYWYRLYKFKYKLMAGLEFINFSLWNSTTMCTYFVYG